MPIAAPFCTKPETGHGAMLETSSTGQVPGGGGAVQGHVQGADAGELGLLPEECDPGLRGAGRDEKRPRRVLSKCDEDPVPFLGTPPPKRRWLAF